MRAWITLVFALAAIVACNGSSSSTKPLGPAPSTCNGHAELCARTYDQVAFAGTHDAYSNLADGYQAADQSYPLSRQLDDGVRVLHLEMLPDLPAHDQALLCHGLCALGQMPLTQALGEVKTFLDSHPSDVVTLLMEGQMLPSDIIAQSFHDSGVDAFVHPQASGAAWPTLSDLIRRGERVVVFYADMSKTGGTAYPWLLDRFAFTWETPWDNEKLADFSRCDADRGNKGNSLYVVDTYLEDMPIQTAANAARVNKDPFLVDRILHCQQTQSKLPNFVMVNYYETSDVLAVVDVLNGFAPAPSGAGASAPGAFDGAEAGAPSDAGAD